MAETWKPVSDFIGYYEVSDLGRVRSVDREVVQISPWGAPMRRRLRGKILAPGPDKDGYLLVNLSVKNYAATHKVHHLVLQAFVGECPRGLQGCHNDRNPMNNRLDNLRWDTPIGNEADKLVHGTHVRGERQGQAKLTEKDILAIRASTLMGTELAQKYGVSPGHISNIRNRCRSWRWM